MPHIIGTQLSGSARAEFVNLWTETLGEVLAAPATWTLRDYHSPNLIWLPEREGLQRVGMIDFQDAVLGRAGLRRRLAFAGCPRDRAAGARTEAHRPLCPRAESAPIPPSTSSAFARAYAIMGAQRATKILGIFARLDRRDGKPHYLKHLPRIEAYLIRNLAHPALAKLQGLV